ncbi:MAG: diguanylate cyclase [Nitrospirae bacterium]|nr:diguanylate cyclase [Candidatus Manganitrophaceae bacterium]
MSEMLIRIAIVGGGKGGLALLQCFAEIPDIQLVGITDINKEAVGMQEAARLGIPSTTSLLELITRDEADLILDVTSDPDMPAYILEHKRKSAELFSGTEARLLWQLVQNMLRQNRQIRSLMDQIRSEAMRDTLTGLYNRRYFDHRAEEEIIRADRNKHGLAFLLCDLDNFKSLNETKGRQLGDEILKAVALEIKQLTRGSDLIFRWGGDEIVVVLAKATREGVFIAADRIRKGIRKIGKKARVPLDLSIGVSLYPDHGDNLDKLIHLADRALYIARRGGEKIHIGDEGYPLNETAVKVVFQPIIDLRSKEIIGYEALTRDPKGKLNVFDLFRRYHTIGQLNELKQICFSSQIKAAEEHRLDRLFINIDSEILSRMDSIPKPAGVDVILEISEAEALHNVERHLRMAERWREKGFKFAIDDFGAGFISLPFVAQLMPDYIKIDRLTTLQAVSSKKFRNFLKNLITALQEYVAVGMVAEGIETDEELEIVGELGVHLAQGYLLGKPKAFKTQPPRPRLPK